MTEELSKQVFKNFIYFLKPTVPFDSEAIFANRLTKELKFDIMGLSRKSLLIYQYYGEACETVCGRP